MTKQIDDGGQAFPSMYGNEFGGTIHYGMTLRDYFAGQALAASEIPKHWSHKITAEITASAAYAIADAMLRVRKEER